MILQRRIGRLLLFPFLACVLQLRVYGSDYFVVTVIDEQTGRGVPLVQLETVSHARWWTDSNGIVAFDDPGLMGQEVYFHVHGDGYEYPKDFFGFRGIKLKPTRGGAAVIKLKRLNIAERLYRITGEGIYRDTVLAGGKLPTFHPLLDGQVAGQDTVIAAPYRKKIYWFWGDTDRVGYPIGNFGASGATSDLPGRAGLDPSVGVNLKYFVGSDGFSKPMCPLPGKGLRWIEGLFPVIDDKGVEHLVARVANVRDLGYVNDWHLMVFNDDKEIFESVRRWDIHVAHDSAHPFLAQVDGVSRYYIYPNWRVNADLKSLADLSSYEALTCISGDGKVDATKTEIDRDEAGRVRYSWKPGADRLHPSKIQELISAGKLKPQESWIQLHDFETGKPIEAGRGSVYWNDFRQRWVMIVTRQMHPGEIWFTEADTPTGPWVYARRVLSHENYNFYNPTQHPFFDQDGGRLIYFQGTYTAAFSDAREKTPRYDYNQIMYRLTLDDPRLALPAPVYRIRTAGGPMRYSLREGVGTNWASVEEAPFFAIPPSRSTAELTPVFAGLENGRIVLQTAQPSSGNQAVKPVFFALPLTERVDQTPGEFKSGAVAALYDYIRADGEHLYSIDPELKELGLKRKAEPLCRVWKNPMATLVLDTKTQPVAFGAR